MQKINTVFILILLSLSHIIHHIDLLLDIKSADMPLKRHFFLKINSLQLKNC